MYDETNIIMCGNLLFLKLRYKSNNIERINKYIPYLVKASGKVLYMYSVGGETPYFSLTF
jgi:hypothetical protein